MRDYCGSFLGREREVLLSKNEPSVGDVLSVIKLPR
jgi:hypothetical protein